MPTFEDGANFLQSEQSAELSRGGIRGQAAKPTRIQSCSDGVLHGAIPFLVIPFSMSHVSAGLFSSSC